MPPCHMMYCRIGLLIALAVVLCMPPAWAKNDPMDDVIKVFQMDVGRTNLSEMVGRYKSVIKELTNLGIKPGIKIKALDRSSANEEFYKEIVEKSYKNLDIQLAGEEFFLKTVGVIDQDGSITNSYNPMISNITGMYMPENHELVMVRGSDAETVKRPLLHELFRAAQSSYFSWDALYALRKESKDAAGALAALIEGQAVMAEILARANKNIKDGSIAETLERSIDEYESRPEHSGYTDFFTRMQSLTSAYGYIFAAKRYISSNRKSFQAMLEDVPQSSEQILHYDKFENNETPVVTSLEKWYYEFERDWKLLFNTTIGELEIRTIFDTVLDDKTKSNAQAAEGWGGDRVCVFESGENRFFVWETVWDRANDVDEFFSHYKKYYEKRMGVQRLRDMETDAKPRLFITRNGLNVLIIEGSITDEITRTVTELLSYQN